jgi:hypothetical protein
MRGLGLMIRMAAVWAGQAPDMLSNFSGAIEMGVDHLVCPRLTQQLMSANMCASRPYIPPHLALKPKQLVSFTLHWMRQSDHDIMQHERQQLQWQKQEQERRQVQPREHDTPSGCRPWFSVALAAAESVRLLQQICMGTRRRGGTYPIGGRCRLVLLFTALHQQDQARGVALRQGPSCGFMPAVDLHTEFGGSYSQMCVVGCLCLQGQLTVLQA